jgi:hypothetical protein
MRKSIQQDHLSVSAAARLYSFTVTDEHGVSRHFNVNVPLESFRSTPLKFQDGPLLSRECLEQHLATETDALPAATNLNVSAVEIRNYLDKHYPRKERAWPRILPKRARGG